MDENLTPREKKTAYQKAWRAANPEKGAAYREANRERLREANRRYYRKNKEKVSARILACRRANPEVARAANRRWSTGFCGQLVGALRKFQAGACAICAVHLNVEKRLSRQGECADHCHATGQPRGLICQACNTALGLYEKHQRPAGLVIEPYEKYLADPPVRQLGWTK
jgi:hypothetical protein